MELLSSCLDCTVPLFYWPALQNRASEGTGRRVAPNSFSPNAFTSVPVIPDYHALAGREKGLEPDRFVETAPVPRSAGPPVPCKSAGVGADSRFVSQHASCPVWRSSAIWSAGAQLVRAALTRPA
jgi:hypothetical protein